MSPRNNSETEQMRLIKTYLKNDIFIYIYIHNIYIYIYIYIYQKEQICYIIHQINHQNLGKEIGLK